MSNSTRAPFHVFTAFVALSIATLELDPAAAQDCFGAGLSTDSAPEFGLDYGLRKRCATSQTYSSGSQNAYVDSQDCLTSPPPATEPRWILGNHSGQCEGPWVSDPLGLIGDPGQILPINTPGSPLGLEWIRERNAFGQDAWAVRLTTDLFNNSFPCFGGPSATFLWFGLNEHQFSGAGGPYPPAGALEQVMDLHFREWGAKSTAYSRLGASIFIVWPLSDPANLQRRQIDVNLYLNPHWPDNINDDANGDLLIGIYGDPAINFEGLSVDARSLQPAIDVTHNRPTEVRIPWHAILAELIDRGHLDAPPNYTTDPLNPWSDTEVRFVNLWTEAKIEASFVPGTPFGAVLPDVTVRDFRIESRQAEAGSVVTTAVACGPNDSTISVMGSGLYNNAAIRQLQLFDANHQPVGAPLAPTASGAPGSNLQFDIPPASLVAEPQFLRILNSSFGEDDSNWQRTPPLIAGN